MNKRVLLACEESQIVTIEMRKLGLEAYSCDIQDCSGDYPQFHLKQDVVPLLKEDWALIIAFPPCTHLCSSGAKWFAQKKKNGQQDQAISFFMNFVNCRCERIAIENPVGIMSTVYRKPDQIIHPWQFGEPFSKRTCLWLKGLPKLVPTNIVDKGEYRVYDSGRRLPLWYANMSHKDRDILRSRTFRGIAEAMANQWGTLIL